MIAIHSTKKLFAKLPVDEYGLLPSSAKEADSAEQLQPPGLLSGWQANLITLQRRNCVLLVHDQTRFPLFIPALKKADLARLNVFFDDVLMNTLLKCGATQQQLEIASHHLEPLRIDTTCNRSVQGTMNQMAWEIGHILHYHGSNVAEMTGYSLSARLADRPCTVKGHKDCLWPIQEFFALLDGHSEVAVNQPDNVIELAKYRK